MLNELTHQQFDAIIVGGGPAGCATVLSLTRNDPAQNLRLLLLDDADPTAYKIGESLPASARHTLANLHPTLPARLAQDTAAGLHGVCSGNASAWAGPRLQETHALMNPYGAGWHLDRARFDATLREACGGVLRRGKCVAVRRAAGLSGGWEVDVESVGAAAVETVCTKWVVDATGRKAAVARKLGGKVHKHSDLLSFYVVFTQSDPAVSADHDARTLIEAAPSGWWYTALLPHGKRLVMYTTAPADATARVARTTAGFRDMLRETALVARALRGSSGADEELYVDGGARFTRHTTACSAVLEPYAVWEPMEGEDAGRGWCAVGDAALAFDPLSSQGMITALNSGAFLGGVLARQLGASAVPTEARLQGANAVSLIREAYEQVRMKYEEGRSYYYRVVDRFENDGDDEGEATFWKNLRRESGISASYS